MLVIPEDGELCSNSAYGYLYGGLAVTDAPGKSGSSTTVEIISSGFRVYSSWNGTYGAHIYLNNNNKKYNYIAIG